MMEASPNDDNVQQPQTEQTPHSFVYDFFNYQPMVRTVPGYGLLYYDHIYSEYILFTSEISDEEERAISEINASRSSNRLTWREIYTFELILLKYRPLQ